MASIVVPFFGLTNFRSRVLHDSSKVTPKRNYNGDYRYPHMPHVKPRDLLPFGGPKTLQEASASDPIISPPPGV